MCNQSKQLTKLNIHININEGNMIKIFLVSDKNSV